MGAAPWKRHRRSPATWLSSESQATSQREDTHEHPQIAGFHSKPISRIKGWIPAGLGRRSPGEHLPWALPKGPQRQRNRNAGSIPGGAGDVQVGSPCVSFTPRHKTSYKYVLVCVQRISSLRMCLARWCWFFCNVFTGGTVACEMVDDGASKNWVCLSQVGATRPLPNQCRGQVLSSAWSFLHTWHLRFLYPSRRQEETTMLGGLQTALRT